MGVGVYVFAVFGPAWGARFAAVFLFTGFLVAARFFMARNLQ
jgi:hypothetical protein